MKYDYETIPEHVPSEARTRKRYRIRDVASDNAIASSYDEANAKLVVRALNALGADYMSYMRGVVDTVEKKKREEYEAGATEANRERRERRLQREAEDALDGRGGPSAAGVPGGFDGGGFDE